MSSCPFSPPSKKTPTEKEKQPAANRRAESSSSTPDAKLSAKLSSMSMEERSKGLDEVHGIADVPTETPGMLKEKLKKMNRALLDAIASLSAEDSLAYREAIAMSQDYVDGLKIRFLRAEHGYNNEKAALRMISFFAHKKELFGKEKLVREILLEDLCADAREALHRGLIQVFHQRDRSGRPIFYIHGLLNMIFPLKPCFEAFYYVIMAGIQDEMSQLRGCVCLWNALGVDCFLNRTSSYWKLWTSMPLRHTACHILVDNVATQSPMMDVLANKLESEPLCRFRFHYGTHMEGIYQLLTFGIPREAIPLKNDGSLDLSHHHKLLKILESREAAKRRTAPRTTELSEYRETAKRQGPPHRQFQPVSTSTPPEDEDQSPPTPPPQQDENTEHAEGEDDSKEEDVILIPSPMDVLLGRGRRPNNRPGTLRMFHLLHENMDAYDACTRPAQKTTIAMNIVKEMKDAGCRFLREAEEGGGYVEIDDSAARAKVAHRFRDLRRNIKAANTGIGSTVQQDSDADRTNKKRTHH